MSGIKHSLVIIPHGKDDLSFSITRELLKKIQVPKSVILLCPNHSELGPKFSIKSNGQWLIETGAMPVETNLAKKIQDYCPWFREDETALIEDECLDKLAMNILQHSPQCKIVPILFQHTTFERCQLIARGLTNAIGQFAEPILTIATAHLSEFEDIQLIKEQDKSLLDFIQDFKAMEFYEAIEKNRQSSCGAIPVTILISMAQELGLKKADLKKYQIHSYSNKPFATSHTCFHIT